MDSKKTIIHIIVLLALVVLISSEVSARVFTETFSNTKKGVEKINEINKIRYNNGGYRGFGGRSYNSGYMNNGGGYYSGYPNGGVYPGNGGGGSYYSDGGYPNNGGGYPSNGGYGGDYPINGGGYPINGGYGRGYTGNVGGNNGNDFLGSIGGIINDIVGNIGGVIGGRGGGVIGVQTKDNTRN